jgi:TonB-dependent siderophore receptor
MLIKPLSLSIAALFVHAYAQPAWAQVQEKNDTKVQQQAQVALPHVEVKANGKTEKSVVSGATKTSSDRLEIPLSISVVSSESLRERAVNSSKDALAYTPGIIAGQGEGRRDEFYIRGFYSPRDTMLDGMRDDTLFFRDIATTDTLEVIKGATAALYGRGAAGGLINRITKKPQAKQDQELSLALGSHQQRRISVDAGGAINSDVNTRFIAAYDVGNSYRDVVEHQRRLLAPSLTWAISPKTELLLQAEIQREDHTPDRGIPSLNGRAVKVKEGTFYGEKFDFTTTDSDLFKAKLEHKFNSQLSLINQLQYTQTELDGVNTRNRRVNTNGSLSRQITYFPIKQTNILNQTEVSYATGNHLFLFGFEAAKQQRDTIVKQTGVAFPVDLLNPQQILAKPDFKNFPIALNTVFKANTAAAYIQDQIALTDQWDALIGVRFDQFKQNQINHVKKESSDRTDNLLSPRASLVYKISPQQSAYLTASRSYQPAGGDLLYTGSKPFNQVRPLYTNLQEIGYKQDWLDKRMFASVALFRVEQGNQLTADPTDVTGLRQLQIGRQRNQGIEIEVQGNLTSQTQVNANFTYNDAKILASNDIRVGNRAEMTPARNASVWLKQTLSSNWSLGAGIVSHSSQFALSDNTVRLPGYVRTDLALSYIQPSFDLVFKLNNLTNIHYMESANNNVQIQPGAPLHANLVLKMRF